jgi:predicted kinase
MPEQPSTRSVKISDDERGGWSSDRPRREGSKPREVDVSVRSRILPPTDRMRYSPGSLLVVVSASAAERDRFVARVLEDGSGLLAMAKVRGLLEGRVGADELESRAAELLDAAVLKRLEAGDTVVIAADGLDPAERARYVRPAHRLRRPRHLILLDVGRDQISDEDRPVVNELRRALDAGELGAEGFQTVMRLGGGTISELKRIVFRPPPADND